MMRFSLFLVAVALGCAAASGCQSDANVTPTFPPAQDGQAGLGGTGGELEAGLDGEAEAGPEASGGTAGIGGTGGVGGAAGMGGLGGTGGFGGGGEDPEVVSVGAKDKFLFKGIVVTPDTADPGEVLVEGEVITCVGASCSAEPGAATATVIDTHAMIFPGMIDTHNHILYDVFDEDDWTPKQLYSNHNQWTQEPEYGAMQDCYNYLLNSTASGGVNLDCEVLKYGELKGMVVGTTSILGEPKGMAMNCYESLSRSIDGSQNRLPKTQRTGPCLDPPPDTFTQDPASNDHIQVAALGIDTVDEVAARQNFRDCKTWSYVVHVGEGKPGDMSAHGEWTKVVNGALDVEQFSIIHGTSFEQADFQHMADKGMKLIWSPKSNMFLYGQTTRIDLARQISPHLVIALAPDWSLGGSVNLIDELNFAYDLDQQQWGGILSAQDLVKMVTIEAARAINVDNQLGSLEKGKLADLFVLTGDVTRPYDSLVHARPSKVRLVMIGGKLLVGDSYMSPIASLPECDTIDLCGSSRFVCVKEQTTSDKLNQSYQDIVDALSKALTDYDATAGTKFSPIAPLVRCP